MSGHGHAIMPWINVSPTTAQPQHWPPIHNKTHLDTPVNLNKEGKQ